MQFYSAIDSKMFYCTATLFYVTTLTNQFRSARRTVKNVLVVKHVLRTERKFPAPSYMSPAIPEH